MASTSPILVLFGSGPGIGLAVASLFAQKHFDTIALCARDASRLESEKSQVEAAAAKAGRTDVRVHAFPTDLANLDSVRKTLKSVEELGPLGCVYHNAARIKFGEPLSTEWEEVEEDFKVGNLSLYIIAQWAIPLLRKSPHPNPSFFVTNSALPEHPFPILLSLSMSKASQQNMMMSLHGAFGEEIHFGIVKVGGQVSPEAKVLNPTNIAVKAVELYEQPKGEWKLTTELWE